MDKPCLLCNHVRAFCRKFLHRVKQVKTTQGLRRYKGFTHGRNLQNCVFALKFGSFAPNLVCITNFESSALTFWVCRSHRILVGTANFDCYGLKFGCWISVCVTNFKYSAFKLRSAHPTIQCYTFNMQCTPK